MEVACKLKSFPEKVPNSIRFILQAAFSEGLVGNSEYEELCNNFISSMTVQELKRIAFLARQIAFVIQKYADSKQ